MATMKGWNDLCGFPGCPSRCDTTIVVLLEHPYDHLPEERTVEVCSDHAAAVAVTTERALLAQEAQA